MIEEVRHDRINDKGGRVLEISKREKKQKKLPGVMRKRCLLYFLSQSFSLLYLLALSFIIPSLVRAFPTIFPASLEPNSVSFLSGPPFGLLHHCGIAPLCLSNSKRMPSFNHHVVRFPSSTFHLLLLPSYTFSYSTIRSRDGSFHCTSFSSQTNSLT